MTKKLDNAPAPTRTPASAPAPARMRLRAATRPAGAETTMFLPDTMRQRLGQYILDRYSGKMNVRNEIILQAIEALLTKEGY